MEALKERLMSRGTEPIEKINQRLAIAEEEMKQIDMYDHVVVNDDLDRATEEVRRIITREV